MSDAREALSRALVDGSHEMKIKELLRATVEEEFGIPSGNELLDLLRQRDALAAALQYVSNAYDYGIFIETPEDARRLVAAVKARLALPDA